MQKDQKDSKNNKINKKTFKRLLGIYSFMVPYRTWFILGLISLVFSSTVLLGFPYFTGKLIDTSLGKNDWLLKGIDGIALGLVAILVIQSVFSFLRIYFFAQVSERSMADIRRGLYEKYMTLPVSFFDSRRTGELFSRITADVSLLQDTFTVTLSEFIRQTSILIIGIVVLFVTNPELTLFMLATIPILVVSGFLFGKFIRKLSKKTQDALADANIVVEETLQAVSTVKTFTNELFEVMRYSKSLNEVVNLAIRNSYYRGGFVSFIIFALFGGIVLVLWYGASLVDKGDITIGELTSFIIYTMFIGGSIGGLGNIYGSLQKAVGASDRVLEILDKEAELVIRDTSKEVIQRFKGNIIFEGVKFAYPTRKDITVLKGINFIIEPGEKV
ncbi:MAG: ABC transporter transmembrane domain-containing protein, partial [Bacteroidota bacterium]